MKTWLEGKKNGEWRKMDKGQNWIKEDDNGRWMVENRYLIKVKGRQRLVNLEWKGKKRE